MASQSVTRLTQAERTEISDRRMFSAAIKLINEFGPTQTNLKDVGIEAGYSRGLANHRFGNKDNLFAFVMRRLSELWLEQMIDATANKVGMEAIEHALKQHYAFCVESPDYVRAFYMLWFESVNADAELSAIIKSIHRRRHQDVRDWVLSDPMLSSEVKANADAIAGQFSATIIGIIYFWLANPDELEQTKILHDDLHWAMQNLLNNKMHKEALL